MGCGVSTASVAPAVSEEEARRRRMDTCRASLAANGGRLFVSGIVQRANVTNRNGRIYPRDVLFREAEKFRTAFVETNAALGELDHPNPTSKTFRCLSYRNVSHQVLEYHWEGDDLVGAVEVLPTPAGKMLLDLYLAGFKLGVSSRGWATLKKDAKLDVEVIQDDFELVTFDFVSDPSTSGAYLEPIKSRYEPPVQPDLSRVLRLCSQGRIIGIFERDRLHYPDDGDLDLNDAKSLQRMVFDTAVDDRFTHTNATSIRPNTSDGLATPRPNGNGHDGGVPSSIQIRTPQHAAQPPAYDGAPSFLMAKEAGKGPGKPPVAARAPAPPGASPLRNGGANGAHATRSSAAHSSPALASSTESSARVSRHVVHSPERGPAGPCVLSPPPDALAPSPVAPPPSVRRELVPAS